MVLTAKNKLVLSVFLFFSVVICIVTSVSYVSFSNSSTEAKMEYLDTVARSVGKAVAEKTDVYFNTLELASRIIPGESGLASEEGVAERLRLLKQLIRQTGAGEAYYGLQDGRTFTVNGQIPDFNARKLGREW